MTPDKLWIPLRWIAPELLEEYRGSLIVTDQTKTSNVWWVFLLIIIINGAERADVPNVLEKIVLCKTASALSALFNTRSKDVQEAIK